MNLSLQNPASTLLLAITSTVVSLLIGAVIGIFNPTVGIIAPPYLGVCILVGVAAHDADKHSPRTEAKSLIVSTAIIGIPFGTIGVLITR